LDPKTPLAVNPRRVQHLEKRETEKRENKGCTCRISASSTRWNIYVFDGGLLEHVLVSLEFIKRQLVALGLGSLFLEDGSNEGHLLERSQASTLWTQVRREKEPRTRSIIEKESVIFCRWSSLSTGSSR